MSTVNEDTEKYNIVLDDDPIIPEIIEKTTGLKSLKFTNVEDLMARLPDLHPTAVFIDIMLSTRKTGLEILPELREKWPFCPILVVTGTPNQSSIVVALSSGADDFIRKPIVPEELMARLKLRLEEAAFRSAKEVVQFGDITIHSVYRTVEGPKGKRYASPIEVTLLACLALTDSNIIEKNSLKFRCWGQVKVTDNALHRKLHAVRQILKDVSDTVYVETKYGVGFTLKHQSQAEIAERLEPRAIAS